MRVVSRLALATFAVLAGACSSSGSVVVPSSDDANVGGDTGVLTDARPACPADASPAACSACSATACVDQGNACAADVECSAQVSCDGACTNQSCIDECVSAHPSPLATAYVQCVDTKCADPCCAASS